MAYAKGFEYDVFVSYARADDDEPMGEQGGWVSNFVLNLERALRQRLGGSDELKIFFDHRDLSSNHQLDELIGSVKSSALFLAVTSRSYVRRNWTKRELDTFVKKTDDLKSLFAVEYLPLDSEEQNLHPLENHKRLKLWRTNEPMSETPMPLLPNGDELFRTRVHDLAEQMRRQLENINIYKQHVSSIGQVDDSEGNPVERASRGVVMLAQTTDDLEEERDQLQKYLEQFGYLVLPEADYPQGGDSFVEAITRDLMQSDVLIQLLGRSPGKRPPDLPAGYPQVQFELAQQKGIPILQWRRPDIVRASIQDDAYSDLLFGPTVIATGLESFKADVRKQLDSKLSKPADKEPNPELIFINSDQTDLEFARVVQSEFSKRSLSTAIPFFDGPPDAVREDLKENIVDCDVLVLLYGEASPLWVRSQLKLFNKLRPQRSTPPRLLAIFVGPPDDKPRDLGISLPDMHRIDSPTQWSIEHIQSLVEGL